MGICFQNYKFKALVFEYKTTSVDVLNNINTALGTVIMAPEYNVNFPTTVITGTASKVTYPACPFANKQIMESTSGSVSCKPSQSMFCQIDCSGKHNPLPEYFTRTLGTQTGAVTGSDNRFYDMCILQLGVAGVPAANVNLGELWVSYDVYFLKPLFNGPSVTGPSYAHYTNSSTVAAAGIFGTYTSSGSTNLAKGLPTQKLDSIGISFVSTAANSVDTIVFPPSAYGYYQIRISGVFTSAAVFNAGAAPTLALVPSTLPAAILTSAWTWESKTSGGTVNTTQPFFMSPEYTISSNWKTLLLLVSIPFEPASVGIQIVTSANTWLPVAGSLEIEVQALGVNYNPVTQ